MTKPPSPPPEELQAVFESIRARLRVLTVAVLIMALALILSGAAMFSSLINYFAGDAMIFGGMTAGAALLGFAFGWFARRRA